MFEQKTFFGIVKKFGVVWLKTKTLVLILAAAGVFFVAIFLLSSSPKAKTYADDASSVMYFFSPQCKYCKLQEPILEELAQEGFRVKLMDVLAHPEYWAQYNVTGTPTFIAANGDKQVGLTQKPQLRAWFESHNARITAQANQ